MSDTLAVHQPSAMERRGFLGGSDMAAVLGISPWKTPYELWEQKLGMEEETEDSEQKVKVLNRGKRLEPVVMEMLQDEYDLTIIARNGVYFDGEYPWMRSEIDFEYSYDHPDLAEGAQLVGNGDVKTVHPYAAKDWGETLTDEVPAYYVAQFQWGMMITGAKVCAVAALIGADDLRMYYVQRDEEIIAMLRERAIDYWFNHVLAEVPPPMKTSADADRMLAKFSGVTVVAPEDVKRAIRYLKGVKAAEKRLELKRDEFETAVKLTLAMATKDETGGKYLLVDEAGKKLASWNPQSTSRVSAKKVKELHPDIVGEVTETSTFRVLRLA